MWSWCFFCFFFCCLDASRPPVEKKKRLHKPLKRFGTQKTFECWQKSSYFEPGLIQPSAFQKTQTKANARLTTSQVEGLRLDF